MQKKIRTYASPRVGIRYALRIAMIVFIVLLSGTGIVTAASNSKPGEMLYPVKQAVETVTTTFTPVSMRAPSPTPVPQQRATSEKIPAEESVMPTTEPIVNKTVNQTVDDVTPTMTPTPTLSPTPTPKPADQGVLPAVDKTVDTVFESLPLQLPVGGIPPTPTPQPTHEGSKDNGSDAGAGGSLLPQLKNGL